MDIHLLSVEEEISNTPKDDRKHPIEISHSVVEVFCLLRSEVLSLVIEKVHAN